MLLPSRSNAAPTRASPSSSGPSLQPAARLSAQRSTAPVGHLCCVTLHSFQAIRAAAAAKSALASGRLHPRPGCGETTTPLGHPLFPTATSSITCCRASTGAGGSSGRQSPSDRDWEISKAEIGEIGGDDAADPLADLEEEALRVSEGRMDPQQRKTVEVVEVDIIEGENGEPGSSMMGTMAGTAAGAALGGGLAAAAALSAPLAAAAAAVGAMMGAVAGGAMGKEVPRGVDADSAMEFDQPAVVRAGQEADEQEAIEETVWDESMAPPPASPGAVGGGGGGGGKSPESHHGRPTLGEHEIGDIRSSAGGRQP